MRNFRISITLLVLLTILLGFIYPAFVWISGRVLFPDLAEGNIIYRNGITIGSNFIGQQFTSDRYFWSRPSATPTFPYNPMVSASSNLNPANPILLDRVKAEAIRLKEKNHSLQTVPIDLVTTSGSGLDPDISPPAAFYQLKRIAKARNISPHKLKAFISKMIEKPTFGFLGQARINVLRLNLSLDAYEGNLK